MFKDAFRPILEQGFIRKDYEGSPQDAFAEGAKELERLIPDFDLRQAVRLHHFIMYPIDKTVVFFDLAIEMNIYNAAEEAKINLAEKWVQKFEKTDLSEDFLRWLLDFFVKNEYAEGVLIVAKRLADDELLDEDGRFEL